MKRDEFIIMMKTMMTRAKFLEWSYNLVLSEWADLKKEGVRILIKENPKALGFLAEEHVKRSIPFNGRRL